MDPGRLNIYSFYQYKYYTTLMSGLLRNRMIHFFLGLPPRLPRIRWWRQSMSLLSDEASPRPSATGSVPTRAREHGGDAGRADSARVHSTPRSPGGQHHLAQGRTAGQRQRKVQNREHAVHPAHKTVLDTRGYGLKPLPLHPEISECP